MTTHIVKSWPEFFEQVKSGNKRFELRKNDRDYKIGDLIRLREWEPYTQVYSGCELLLRITHMLEATGPGGIEPYRGLAAGYAILGIEIKNET